MAEAGGETETLADRLEAALDRIAAVSVRQPPRAPTIADLETAGSLPPGDWAEETLPAFTERLDTLIKHLRDVLDASP